MRACPRSVTVTGLGLRFRGRHGRRAKKPRSSQDGRGEELSKWAETRSSDRHLLLTPSDGEVTGEADQADAQHAEGGRFRDGGDGDTGRGERSANERRAVTVQQAVAG